MISVRSDGFMRDQPPISSMVLWHPVHWRVAGSMMHSLMQGLSISSRFQISSMRSLQMTQAIEEALQDVGCSDVVDPLRPFGA